MFDSLSWTQFFTQFHFIRPLWLLALIPMFFLVWLRWREESKPSWKDILPEHLRNAFKTVTVRNVALTAPYMHNGVYSTLEEVVDFYNRGGGLGLGLAVPNQTLSGDALGLTQGEIKDLVIFMETLTDTTNLTQIPVALPQFEDEKLNNRVIGGKY